MSRKKNAREQTLLGDPSKRGKHKVDEALRCEPKTESGLVCPDRLTGDARDLFQFFREQLSIADVDSKVDSPSLATACTALATSWKADRHLAREGEVRKLPVLAGVGGARRIVGHRQVKNRWWSVKVESEKTFRAFANQFGICGPSSRAGLQVNGSKAADSELWARMNVPRPPKEPPRLT